LHGTAWNFNFKRLEEKSTGDEIVDTVCEKKEDGFTSPKRL
jgi:hypothetical protein